MRIIINKVFLTFLIFLVLSFNARSVCAKQNDILRIYAFGDSITNGVNSRTLPVDVFRYLLAERLQKKYGVDTRVYNGGIGGQDTQMADKRFQEVLEADVDIVLIMFGSNDASLKSMTGDEAEKPRVTVENYKKTIEKWIDALKKKGIAVILMTPPPVTQKFQRLSDDIYLSRDQNSITKKYVYACKEIAIGKKIDLVDNFNKFLELKSRYGSIDNLYTDDGLHLNALGNKAIANNIIDCAFEPTRGKTINSPNISRLLKINESEFSNELSYHKYSQAIDVEDDNNGEIASSKVDYSNIIKSGYVNLCLNKTYIESSPDKKCIKNTLNDGEANVDERLKQYFCDASPKFPKWLIIDLGGNFEIRTIVIYNSPEGEAKKIKLFFSKDFKDFKPVASFTFLKKQSHYKLNLRKATRSRYLKIEFLDSYSTAGIVSLNEVEIWGKK